MANTSLDDFKEGDAFIANRGFGRCKSKFTLLFPRSLKGKQKQLSTMDANCTRSITKWRGVIERAFGRIKQWKILAETIDCKLVPKVHDLFRCLAAISNAIFPPLLRDSPLNDYCARRIIEVSSQENELLNLNVSTGWRKKGLSVSKAFDSE